MRKAIRDSRNYWNHRDTLCKVSEKQKGDKSLTLGLETQRRRSLAVSSSSEMSFSAQVRDSRKHKTNVATLMFNMFWSIPTFPFLFRAGTFPSSQRMLLKRYAEHMVRRGCLFYFFLPFYNFVGVNWIWDIAAFFWNINQLMLQ